MPFKSQEAYRVWKRAWVKKQKLINPDKFRKNNYEYCKKYRNTHKKYLRKYNKQWQQNNIDKVRLYRINFLKEKLPLLKRYVNFVKHLMGCKNCSEKDISCLQFHHINPANKIGCVSRFHEFGLNKIKIQKEIKKCIVLCSNCHDKHHAKERQAKSLL